MDELGAAQSTVRLRSGRYGPRRIERELASRGFTREIVDAALESRDREVEERSLSRALAREWKRFEALPLPVRRRRAIDALARRGFAPEKVSEMIERFRKNDEIDRGPRALS